MSNKETQRRIAKNAREIVWQNNMNPNFESPAAE